MTTGADAGPRVAVVVPVYGNAATLVPLADRLAAALAGRDWRLRLVIDASPDDSAAVAAGLAAAAPRIAVTVLAVNVGTGVQTSTEELVATAERVTGRPIATVPGAHPGRDWDTADWVCDPSAAGRLLDWTPTVDLAEGLARTWAAV